MAFRRPRITYLLPLAVGALGLLAGPHAAIAQTTSALAAAPHETTPLPPTTTQEPLVNPVGLSEAARYGWQPDFIGPWRGIFDASVGVKFWPDRFNLRNFIFGGAMDIAPGFRVRANFRRREGEEKAFQVDADEIYAEAFNQYRARDWQVGASLRVGHIRYLHFPYPDAIAEFDQVPGYHDLFGGPETDYRSVVLVAEASLNTGFGVHASGRASGFLDNDATEGRLIDAYGFYRHDFGQGWHFEGRVGSIAVRQEPLGRAGQFGGDIYLGKQIGSFNVGLLYENKQIEHEYAGIMVQFRPGPITRALGKVDFDYSRSPEGFTVQIPLLHERMNESRFVHTGDVLVGEIRAVRIRTLWQQGYVRNEYEHRLETWGETASPRLRCVVVEEPWYLQAEALVSPHLLPSTQWEHDRQGPGQFVQRVTYRYYRPFKKSNPGGA